MEVTGYLSEINLRRLAELEIWRRKYSQIQTTQLKILLCKNERESIQQLEEKMEPSSNVSREERLGDLLLLLLLLFFNFVGRTMPVCRQKSH